MSREIKFRAWRENKMHYNITTAHYEHNAMSGSGGDLWDFAEWMKWSKVMQYTGMKDKNGAEIYEGDIIKYDRHDDPVIIRWTEEGMDYTGWIFEDLFTQGGPFEVIGNIFENSELLK
jgi:hypothetical protein